jgi:predicted DNA-binding protein with PD1-like motif
MTSRLLHEENGLKTLVVVFDKGEEVRQALLQFAGEHHIASAHLAAIGAFSRVLLGFFDRELKDYEKTSIDEQVELLSFNGNIVGFNDKPKLHAHVVVGKRDCTAHGGHLLEGHVWPTVEMIITETPQHLRRVRDEETGLVLIAPEAA